MLFFQRLLSHAAVTAACVIGLVCFNQGLPAAEPLSILFLGDDGHHQPRQLAEVLIPALGERGVTVTYTEDLETLSRENLKQYAGLMLYANIDILPAEQENALLEYVAEGGGFVPLHCASYCFRNSAAFVDLVGAQFQRHGGEIFSTEIVAPDHPLMQGFDGFRSWDETYIHTRHNENNRIVLEVRRAGDQAAGRTQEPWTWIRTHGSGRVFYTAWGHDARTWNHPGFQNLVHRGILWACGADPAEAGEYREADRFAIPKMSAPRTDVADFEYVEVGPKIPNYVAGEKWGEQGEIITTMQKPLPPQESIKHFVTPQDFHLELFVSEPDIQGKPIAMNWDERGRLWVCETVDYPNDLQPPNQGRDRIRICEDTDGDGRADHFVVFAENLSIPTALEFCRGGVIVQAGIETLFLRDNDGDGRADQRDVLISGWAMGDTHGGVSNFQYGLDNYYWAMQGYNNSRPKFAGGTHAGFRMGPFRFATDQPDTSAAPVVSEVEFIRSTTNNSWGLGTTEEGLIFASTANRAPSFFVPIPNRYYERVRGWTPSLLADQIAADHYFDPITDKVRQVDHHHGYTAGAGHAIYSARTYPRSWWNRVAFVCGPTGHLVGSFVLNRQGATFRDANDFNLVASDDEWSAPIMAEVGPDGNMWIIDWYNYIVQHNPTPQGFTTGKGNAYESDLRDKKHGRIYRLVYDGHEGEANASVPAKLDPQDTGSLVAALKHPNRLWRRHAQRLLVERGQLDVVEDLQELMHDQQVDATGNNPGAIHALWTLHALLSQPSGDLPRLAEMAGPLLKHPAAGVRRNAALVLPPSQESIAQILQSDILQDHDPQVQLGGLMALADMPSSSAAGVALAHLAGQLGIRQDRYLHEAVVCAAAAHADAFLNELVRLSDIPSAEQELDPARVIAEHLARSSIGHAALTELMATLRDAAPDRAAAVVEGLAAGWPKNVEQVGVPESAEQALLDMLERAESQQMGSLLRLGSAWQSDKLKQYAEKVSQSLYSKLDSNELTVTERIAAAQEVVSLLGSSESAVADLIEAISPQMPPSVASGVIRTLSGASASNVGSELIATWPSLTPALRNDTLTVLLSRPLTTRDLLTAIADGKIAVNDMTLEQRQSLKSHPDRELRRDAARLLDASGATVNADRQKVIESYLAATRSEGDPVQGKLLFTKNCANCHKHSGEGNEVGPDLTGMAVHPKEELLVHILDPNRSVEGNFRRYSVLTADGQLLSGMLAAESLSAVEIVNSEGKRQSISREDIEQITSSNLSVMPEGFEQQIPLPQMTDLLAFLTTKGRFVPLSISSVATAISTKGMFSNSDNGPDRLVFQDWGPKTFQGIPFQLIDPQDKKRPNVILMYGPQGTLPPTMPKQVSLPCNMALKSLHMLSGVSGWGYPYGSEQTTSLIVRIHYQDGHSEDHALLNGVHFADYIRRVDVPESTFAFALRGQQLRYLSIQPKRRDPVQSIELIKGNDASAPIVMAITAESL